MSSERLWVVILALTTFLAGGAAGLLFGLRLQPRTDEGPHAAYRERLVQAFELDAEETARLRAILVEYRDEVEALKERSVSGLEPELVSAGESCRARIRRFVIPPERRGEFDRQVRGGAPPAGSPQ